MKAVLHISANAELTVIRVRRSGETSWIEFRSTLPYHEWGEVPSHAAMLHDMLDGMHATILHAGDSFSLLPRHRDYARVSAFVDIMDRARPPFARNGRIHDGDG